MANSPSPGATPSTPVTGRTQWDAAAELIKQLGSALPWLLMMGGLGWLAYTLREDKQVEVGKAHEELRKTYTQMSELTKNQISNIQSLDTLQQNINKNTNAQYVSLRDLETKVFEEQRKVEAARQAAELARREMDENEKKSKEKGVALADYEKRERELQNRLRSLEEESRTKSSDRAQEISQLRGFLKELTERILEQQLDASSKLAETANSIRNNYFADVGPWLQEFATAETVNRKALDRLIGLSEDRIAKSLPEAPAFTLWMKATSAKDPGGLLMYFGAVGLSEDGYRRFLKIEFDAGRVTDIHISADLVAVAVNDSQDWSRKVLYLGSDDDAEKVPGWDPAAGSWTLVSMIRSLATESVSIVPLKGDPDRSFAVLTPEALAKKYPQYSQISADRAANFAESLRMTRESSSFDAARAWGAGTAERVPDDLRKAVVDVLNAAVKLDETRYKALSGGEAPPLLGRVGALALRPAFKIVGVQLSGMNEGIQMQAADGPGRTFASLVATYQPSYSDRVRRANFYFSRIPGRGWVLASLDEWTDAAKK